jgi:carbon-monoxide dehydrogenase small subunit
VPDTVHVHITVNGAAVERDVEARLLLVHFLRDHLGLTGTHVGCDTSQCGACTVLIDGLPVKSCTVLAAQADGQSVTTVEGLAEPGAWHPVQQAFWEKHGLQCGFCTPGALMLSAGLLAERQDWTASTVREALDGLLCRCTGYENIVRAVLHAQALMQQADQTASSVAEGGR